MEREEKHWSNVLKNGEFHWNDLIDGYKMQERPYVMRHSAGYYFSSMESEWATGLEQDVYGCWWRYLKANTAEYPPPAALPQDDQRRQVADRFGDLEYNFLIWWCTRGALVFAERQPEPFIRLLEPERTERNAPLPKYLVVKIPMSMRRERILSQLRVLLDAYKPGDQMRRHENSTAPQPLHPRSRYEPETYDRALEVWKVKQQNPNWTWWQIGEALAISPSLKATDKDDASARAEKHRDLGTQTRRIFEQAERLMWHGLRGRFPCDDPIPVR